MLQVVLTFVVCLAGPTPRCEELSFPMYEATAQQCMIQAQPMMAAWQNEHPLYTVALDGWKCSSNPRRKT